MHLIRMSNSEKKKIETKVSDQPEDSPRQGGEGDNLIDEEVLDVGFVAAGSKTPKRKRRAREQVIIAVVILDRRAPHSRGGFDDPLTNVKCRAMIGQGRGKIKIEEDKQSK